ncbi:MAG: FlgD immunoglobulin-like domain containing protein, partial [Elusimicrobiota bacterium]
ILLRVPNLLTLGDSSILSAKGGGGGNVSSNFFSSTKAPGGGGGGGRVKLFYRSAAVGAVTLSTAAGVSGGLGGAGFAGAVDASTPPVAGSAGAVSFGVVASSPTGLAASAVYVTSISWAWGASPSFGDGPASSQLYRVFPATATPPFPAPQTTAASGAAGVVENGLAPNTTYFRFATAFTDWGDSAPSNAVSTHTLAAPPASPALGGIGISSLTFSWTSGIPANPSYTSYEVDASTFGGTVETSFAAALSSAPAGLAPNTTYFFRARAINIDGVPTSFAATQAAATLAAAPSIPVAGPVYVTSAVFTWSAGGNPPGTTYVAQVSSDNFFSLTDSSTTLATSATFFTLTPGTPYFLRAQAINWNSAASAFSTVISTVSGNLSTTAPPAAPGAPVADRSFSYDGTALFVWSPGSSPVGILDYNLIVGSLPGANDLFAGTVAVASYTAAGMLTGRTYYAQVRARSNAGVFSLFSPVSAGLPVFIPAQTPLIGKAYSWPNPFDPAKGDAQIGFSLGEAADVTLRIYTLQGRLVRTESSSFGAGNQVMSWNGTSDSGLRAAPGGYIAVLDKHYGSHTETQKIKIAVLY